MTVAELGKIGEEGGGCEDRRNQKAEEPVLTNAGERKANRFSQVAHRADGELSVVYFASGPIRPYRSS